MIIHDISLTTTPETVTWDGTERGFGYDWTQRIGPGQVCNLSVITDGVHTGTHLDAPLHFIENGRSLEQLDVSILVGPAHVVEIFGRDRIEADDCEAAGLPPGTRRVLFKTDNSRRKLLSDRAFHSEYVSVAPSAAAWLVGHGIQLIGIDYLSVGPYGDDNVETHRVLLGAGVVIVETLVLEDIAPGEYFLMALPPKFQGIEGSPCRVLLLEGISEDNG